MWIVIRALFNLLKPRPHVTPGEVDFGKTNTKNENQNQTKDSDEQT